MQRLANALAGASGRGHWTARTRSDGVTIYRHDSGIETTNRRLVEETIQRRPPGGRP